MGFSPFGPVPALALQAATPAAGYTLVNGTGTIISWTAPNDGQLHWVIVFGLGHVTSPQTGGQINISFTAPDGTAKSAAYDGGGHGTGVFEPNNGGGTGYPAILVQAGSAVSVVQQTALTAGASLFWAGIWGL
jgi:hypothetical protein